MAQRLDKFLVEKNFCSTRSKATNLIKNSKVKVNGKIISKPGNLILEEDIIDITDNTSYVSRGALKLVCALEKFNLDFNDKVIADCGASTGGFTQVSLINGAAKVFAIDVGHDQLADEIKNNSNVINLEGVNLKNEFTLSEKVDFCVADLSFISVKLVFKTMLSFLKEGGQCIILIKPQFEAGKDRIGKGGIVKESIALEVIEEMRQWFQNIGHPVVDSCPSPIKGKSGNLEYLFLVR